MAIILLIISISSFLIACMIFYRSSSVLHEIFAGIGIIIWAITFCGAAMVDSIDKLNKELKKINS